MPTETERRVDAVMAVIHDLQIDGLIPKDGRMKPEGMAYVSQVIDRPVSVSTFRRIEKRAKARARRSEKARMALDALLHLRSQQS